MFAVNSRRGISRAIKAENFSRTQELRAKTFVAGAAREMLTLCIHNPAGNSSLIHDGSDCLFVGVRRRAFMQCTVKGAFSEKTAALNYEMNNRHCRAFSKSRWGREKKQAQG